MKLIAHRGWSQGVRENTLAAFARSAADPRLSGVEFDVRRNRANGALLVTHDPPRVDASVLTLDAAAAWLAGTRLELFVEIKETSIAPAVIDTLSTAGIADRSVVFGFAEVARSFPWHAPRRVRLGAILLYPWTMNRFIAAYRPDVILLGWDQRPWTWAAFRLWWSVASLRRLAQRHDRPIATGIVRRQADLDWLARQGVEAAVADMDVIDAAPPPRAHMIVS